jgi:GntR family transcriptional regulator/MocR family aminotransferase
MRQLYHKRRDVLLEALRTELGDRIEIGPADCGMHLTIWLPEGTDDQELTRKIISPNTNNSSLNYSYTNEPPRPGLILSFAAADEGCIRADVRRLRKALDSQDG